MSNNVTILTCGLKKTLKPKTPIKNTSSDQAQDILQKSQANMKKRKQQTVSTSCCQWLNSMKTVGVYTNTSSIKDQDISSQL